MKNNPVENLLRNEANMMTSSNGNIHKMETFVALLDICAGNSPVTGEFPYKGQWRGALMLSLICVWINGLVYNREAGDWDATAPIMTSM